MVPAAEYALWFYVWFLRRGRSFRAEKNQKAQGNFRSG